VAIRTCSEEHQEGDRDLDWERLPVGVTDVEAYPFPAGEKR
jgi:hypothetical protein